MAKVKMVCCGECVNYNEKTGGCKVYSSLMHVDPNYQRYCKGYQKHGKPVKISK